MLLLLVACSTPGDPVEPGVLDLTQKWDDPPAGGFQIASPSFEVEPYSELLKCYFGTYTGPDVGVVYMQPQQVEGYAHHNQLKEVPADDPHQDGELIDCPQPEGSMAPYAPLFEGVGITAEDVRENWLRMPEGIAVQLRSGQRWVMDMHFLNTTADTIRVNNAINIGVMPWDEVEQWAASFQLDAGDFVVSAGTTSTQEFSCAWPTDVVLLSMLGHMHLNGLSYTVDWEQEDGETTRLYEVDPWEPEYRDYPVMTNFEDGAVSIKAGERFVTRCDWLNETSEDFGFPEEMCTTVGVVYPANDPLFCVESQAGQGTWQ